MNTTRSMDPVTCQRAQLTVDDAAPERVGDVMVKAPKILPGNATIADAKQFFENPKVVAAVLLDGDQFAGLLGRDDIPSLVPDFGPVRGYARRAVATVTPDRPMHEAIEIMDSGGLSRLVVLDDDDRTFKGLLCLDLQRAGFCQG